VYNSTQDISEQTTAKQILQSALSAKASPMHSTCIHSH